MSGSPGGASGQESTYQCRRLKRLPGSGRSPGVGNSIHFSIIACKIHGQRSLVDYSPWSGKELDITEWLKHTHAYSHTCVCAHTQTHTHTHTHTIGIVILDNAVSYLMWTAEKKGKQNPWEVCLWYSFMVFAPELSNKFLKNKSLGFGSVRSLPF